MTSRRALTLRKETLTELRADALSQVVGASGPSCGLTGCTTCASEGDACLTGYGCVPTIDHCAITVHPAC